MSEWSRGIVLLSINHEHNPPSGGRPLSLPDLLGGTENQIALMDMLDSFRLANKDCVKDRMFLSRRCNMAQRTNTAARPARASAFSQG